jgi:hypothetical protein
VEAEGILALKFERLSNRRKKRIYDREMNECDKTKLMFAFTNFDARGKRKKMDGNI